MLPGTALLVAALAILAGPALLQPVTTDSLPANVDPATAILVASLQQSDVLLAGFLPDRAFAEPADDFVTTWKTTAANEIIAIPVDRAVGIYSIDWGDGTTSENVTGDQMHSYASAGNHTVRISGNFTKIYLSNDLDNAPKLVSIDRWGAIKWESMARAFYGASDMVYRATDVPDLSEVTDMVSMFRDTRNFNGNVSNWDVSKVKEMSYLFSGARSFNQPLSAWDVSNVTGMNSLFEDARRFNQPLNDWNVLQVTDMAFMFNDARRFNQPLSAWNVSQVTLMTLMFNGAHRFNQPLNDWDVSGVTDMKSMFRDAHNFNQPLNDWDVSGVTDMRYMFRDAHNFNQPLNDWNVSKLTSMFRMFDHALKFNQPLNDWDVSRVTDMSYMFQAAKAFNGNISNWDVSRVTDMGWMFWGADKLDQPLNDWDVSSVTRMNHMFWHADKFNQPLNDWDVSSVTRMDSMFWDAVSFNQPLNDWDVSNVDSMANMFDGATAFDQNLGKWYVLPADTAFDAGDASLNVTTISAQNGFLDDQGPRYGIGAGQNSTLFNVTGNTLMFRGPPDPGNYRVNVTASGSVFESGNNWRVLEVTVSSTSNSAPTASAGPDLVLAEGAVFMLNGSVTDPNGGGLTYLWTQSPASPVVAFSDTSSPAATITVPQVTADTNVTLTLTATDTSSASVTDSLVLAIRETGSAFLTTWNVTETDTTVSIPTEGAYEIIWGDGSAEAVRFSGAQSHSYPDAGTYQVAMTPGLSRIGLSGSGATPERLASIDQWGEIQWTSMRSAFQGASAMTYGAADAPDLSGVTNMVNMLWGATSFNGNISSWDVSNVANMNSMFTSATSFNGNISSWDVSNVANMNSMFTSATSFNGNISSWDVSGVTDMAHMFNGATSFNGNISSWDVSGVTGMAHMFYNASSFNGNISSWDVSGVTDMINMFRDATSFNGNISSWDVSGVADMSGMFYRASSFNGNVSSWDVSGVTDMYVMFYRAYSFNGNISSWNVSNVANMNSMFQRAYSFNGDISSWDVSGVTDMRAMFQGASAFDQNLGNWHVVLDDTVISNATETLAIRAQNSWLDSRNPAYGLGTGGDSDLFVITGGTLGRNSTVDYSGKTGYSVNITSTGDFGTGNHRVYDITVTGEDTIPDTAPTVTSIERGVPASQTTDSRTLVFKVTFSEDVTGVDQADFVLSSGGTGTGSVTNLAGSGSQYLVSVSAAQDGTYNLDLVSSGHGIANAADNQLADPNPTGADHTYAVDTTAPTVTSIVRSDPAEATTSGRTLVFAVTFSEDVTGVDQADFVLSSGGTGTGSVTNLAGSGSQYLVSVSATQDGTYNLDLVSSGHGIADAADNQLADPNPTGADHTYAVDTTAPTVTSIVRSDPAEATTSGRTLVFAVTFSEDVTGVDAGDFALSPDSAGGGSSSGQFTQTSAPAAPITDHNTIQDTITVGPSGTATSVSVAVDITHTYIGDLVVELVAPDGTVQALHSRSGSSANDIDRTYAPGFDGTGIAGDWTLRIRDHATRDTGTLNSWTLTIDHGGADSPVTGLAGSGSRYLVNVSAAQDGTYNLDLVSSGHGITDTPGNPLNDTSPTGEDQSYTVTILNVIPNSMPSVDAGSDQTVQENSAVTLSGTASDADGDPLTYLWSHDSDLIIALSDAASLSTSFTAPQVDSDTTITFTLAAYDETSNATDTTSVTITDSTPPVVPDAPRSIGSVTLASTVPGVVEASWDAPAEEPGDYRIAWAKVGEGFRTWTDLTVNAFPTTTSHAITDLEEGAEYKVMVRARYDGGSGDWSGQYTVTVKASVQDTTDPTITLTGANPAGVTTGTAYSDPGATCTDDADASPTLATTSTVDTLTAGTYQVTYTCTDSSSNTATATRDVVVADAPRSIGSVTLASTVPGVVEASWDAPAEEPGDYRIAWAKVGEGFRTWTDLTVNAFPTTTSHTITDLEEGAEYKVMVRARYDGGSGDWSGQYTVTVKASVQDTTDPTITLTGANPVSVTTGTAYSDPGATCTDDTDASPTLATTSSVDTLTAGTYQVTYTCTDSSSNTATATRDVVVADAPDTTAPTVSSIERHIPTDQNTGSQTLVYRVTFSENVTGVDAGDFALSPDSTGGGSGSGQFTQTSEPATPIADRSTIQDAITVDRSGTATSVSVAVDISHTYRGDLVVDLIAPDGTSQTLHSRAGGSANDIDQTYAPGFDGTGIAGNWTLRVSDRAGGDTGTLNGWTLTIGHGTAGSPVTGLAGSGSQYLVTVSAAQDGTYNLDLVSSDHGITDAADNPLSSPAPTGADHTYTVSATVTDSTAPTLASIERSDPSGELTPASTLVFEVTFSEAVQNVDAGDFELSGTGAGSITVSAVSGDTYNATIAVNTDGAFNLNIAGGHNIEDLAGTGLSSVTPTGADQSYTVDRTAPTVASIARSDPAEATTSERTLVFAVTFSEDVTGVDLSDFALSPDSAGTGSVTNLAGSGSQYLVTVSAAQDGTYNLDLVSSGHGITDAANNQLSSPTPTGADHTYTVSATVTDSTAPTLASIERSDPSGELTPASTLVFEVTFSEAVQNVDAGDFELSGTGAGSITVSAVSGDTYNATIAVNTDGAFNLNIAGGHNIEDLAGTGLSSVTPTGADQSYTVDRTAPTVASIARSDPAEATTSERTLVFAVTFSEDVTGVDVGDFVLSPDSPVAGGASEQFAQTSEPAIPIPDRNTIQDSITVEQSGTATSVSVAVDITHTYIGDLVIDLIAPDDTTRTLHDRTGYETDGIDQTYAPDFGGVGIAGDWTLRVSDSAGGDTGTLNGWTLTINHGGAGSPVTGLAGSGSQYLVTVSAAQDGTYNLDLVSSGHDITDSASNPLSSPTPTGADHTYTRTSP